MTAPSDTVSIKSVFADIFDDNQPVKIALYHFMNQFALSDADKDAIPNVISMAPHYRKRFHIPEDEIPRMMMLLNSCLDAGIDNHFYELQDINTVLDDYLDAFVGVSGLFFEFKFITPKDLVEFGKVIQPFIRLLFTEILVKKIDFDINGGEEEHHCFYLSSATPTYDATKLMYHSTFRVMIPSIMMDPKTRFFIHRRVWKNPSISKLFDDKLNYPLKKCFQHSARIAPVPLYGSCDVDQMERMCLNKIFRISVVKGRTSGDMQCIDMGDKDNNIANPIYCMSVNYPDTKGAINKAAYFLKEKAYTQMEKEMNDGRLFQMAYDEAYSMYLQMLLVDDEIKHMRAMLGMLSNSRFESIDSWLEIVKSLAADPETNRYHCLAVMLTKDRNHLVKEDGEKSPIKWADFEQYWHDAISSTDRTLYASDSIYYWAKCDAPSEVHRYTVSTIRTMMIRDIRHPLVKGRLNHSQFATYLHFMFKNSYVTQDIPKSTPDWYEFVTPRTRDIESGQVYKWRLVGSHPDGLTIYIVNEFKDIATSIYTDMKALCATDGSDKKDARAQIINELSKSYLCAIQKIFSTDMKRAIVCEASSLFKKNTFINRLDKTPHIIGVGNGVLEFAGPDAKLIQYFHTYPISLFTDTKYVPYDETSKYVKTIYKMLRSLVPDDEADALEFLLYYLATSLDGMPKESLFLIIHGGGCHAIDTPIRMFDGSIKMVQDVVVGDSLMGDDNTARTVNELFRGKDDMVRIIPTKGESFEVNKDHVLSLKFACSQEKEGQIFDIKVCDLLKNHSDWITDAVVLIYKANGFASAFSIESIGQGDYYGFELDGNHRYETADGFIHHNSNGKTVLMELFKRTLGECYVRKMPLSFITEQKRTSSSSADPSIMELKNARLVYYSESDRNEKVNVAKVKEITGGETLSGRQLWKTQENFSANCNHIVTTNHRFVIETTEHAVWRRFMSYKFKICFKVEPNSKDPLERPRDPELINKIKNDKRYQEAFLSILIHYRSKLYAQYGGQILRVPHPTIIDETERYRQEEDIYQRYIMNKVYVAVGTNQALETLVNNFREFYRKEGSGLYTGKTADTIHIFRNSTLQSHVKEIGGTYFLVDFASYDTSADGVPSDSMTFAAWTELQRSAKASSQSSGEA